MMELTGIIVIGFPIQPHYVTSYEKFSRQNRLNYRKPKLAVTDTCYKVGYGFKKSLEPSV